ncbi:(2Fe-2S) ferredoxin domain-containing protein [Nocardiopsis sp. NPDC007018]|uniref:(2Fe-2S) ferredoxin domain-containing protein n=1 Tax=Nocardiopsis sp. NPDC007018 TaxID=3155721 RepID=UPI0033BFD3E0
MSAVEGAPCKLTVCRGCCCGTRKKVPGVDHAAQLARLGAIDDHAARRVPVRTSTCLGICFQANVVVVQPSHEGRAAGGRPVWLGRMTEDRLLEALDDWIFQGGPGLAPLPALLEDHVTSKDAKKPKKGKKAKKAKLGKKAKKAKKADKAEKDTKSRKGTKAGKGGGKRGGDGKAAKEDQGGKRSGKSEKKKKRKGPKKEKAGKRPGRE